MQLAGAKSLTRSHESLGVAYLGEADAERTRSHYYFTLLCNRLWPATIAQHKHKATHTNKRII
jgi:hypothetical protein